MSELDLGYLNSLTDGDTELTQELVEIFKAQIPEYVQNLEDAIKSQNTEMLGRIVHKAKSSVLIFGLQDLADKLNDIEVDISQNPNAPFKEAYKQILPFFKTETKSALKQLQELGY